jgi:Flp pilus assembly protein protease CpaA
MHSIILSFPAVVLTAYAAWTDCKRKEIDNWVPVAILTYGIILNAFLNPARFTESIVYMLTVFAVLFTIYIITNGKLGGGDVKLLTALAFFFGRSIMILLLIAGITATAYGVFKGIKDRTYFRTETIFAPPIFVAAVLTSILTF